METDCEKALSGFPMRLIPRHEIFFVCLDVIIMRSFWVNLTVPGQCDMKRFAHTIYILLTEFRMLKKKGIFHV